MLKRALDRTRGWAGEVATLLGRSVGHSYEAFQGSHAADERSPLLAHRGPVRAHGVLHARDEHWLDLG